MLNTNNYAEELFSVTYEIVTPESAENGDVAEAGFIAENVSLRDAIDAVGGVCYEHDGNYDWFTNHEYNLDYQTGAQESRSLHLPDGITGASRVRIGRLLGVNR